MSGKKKATVDELKKGVNAEAEISTESDEALCAELFTDYEERRAERLPYDTQWKLNQRFVEGDQYVYAMPTGMIEASRKDYYWQERQIYNHLAPIIETRLAKLARLSPGMSVLPATGDDADIKTAKLSTMLLKSACRKCGLDALIRSANTWSEVLGTAFFKVAWSDGAREVRFPEGIVSEGDVCMTVCSPYEIFPDNLDAESMEECRSLIHAKAVHIDEIWQRYNVAVSPDAADGMPKNHALVLERYEKPSAGLPDGRLLIAAGGKLLYNGILPYKNGNDGARTIPIIRQTSSKQPGKFFGTSVLERSIPVQRAYNAVKNRKHEFLNRLASGVLAVEDGSVDSDELMEEGLMPGKILSYRQGSAPPAFLNPGHLPGDLTYEEDRLLSEFVTISGVSEVMRSSQTPRNIASGIALQILIEQDESRLNITAEAIRAAIQETAKQTLRLYKQFAGEKRLERLVGENGEIEIFYFSGSDISSDDVVFNTDSQISETPAQKRSFVMELMRSGLLTDENGKLSNRMRLRILEMLGFGAWENSQDIQALHQQRAMSENISLAFELLPDIDDHELHEAEHTKYFLSTEFKRAAERVPAMRGILHAHIKEHKEYKA